MSSEEITVSLWNETGFVNKVYNLLESTIKDEFEMIHAVNKFQKSNKILAEFIFQVSPSITDQDRGKLILYSFLGFDSHLINSLLAFVQYLWAS
jgi:hypothetical protein